MSKIDYDSGARDDVPLRQYIESLLHERDRALQALATANAQQVATLAEATEREVKALAATHEREMAELRTNVLELARIHADAHAQVHVMTQTAVDKAEQSLTRRLEAMNELRAQINLERSRFLPIETYDAKHESLVTAVDTLRREMDIRLKLLETSSANLTGRLWALGAAIALIVVFVNVAIRFWER